MDLALQAWLNGDTQLVRLESSTGELVRVGRILRTSAPPAVLVYDARYFVAFENSEMVVEDLDVGDLAVYREVQTEALTLDVDGNPF